jgi:ABC-2 type transport system ATP-binding protein
MDEAERLCDRLVVIDHGSVVAAGSPGGLIDEFGGGVRVRFTHAGDPLPWLPAVPHVTAVDNDGARYEVRGDGPVLAHVGAALIGHGIEPMDLRAERPTLEDVFLALTDGGEPAA